MVWSTKANAVLFIELMIPAEEGIEAAKEHKKDKYSELTAVCWVEDYPVGLSTTCLLRDAGMTGGNLKQGNQRARRRDQEGELLALIEEERQVEERTSNPNNSRRK